MYKSLGDIPLVKHVDESVYDIALQQRPIILFFHGNVSYTFSTAALSHCRGLSRLNYPRLRIEQSHIESGYIPL